MTSEEEGLDLPARMPQNGSCEARAVPPLSCREGPHRDSARFFAATGEIRQRSIATTVRRGDENAALPWSFPLRRCVA